MWAVIPARWGSSRLPGKVLAYIGGQTMLRRVWAAARSASCFERVLVATDDDRVAREAAGFGASVARTGPASSGTARAALVTPRDVPVVVVQADQPFLDPAMLRMLAERAGPGVTTLAAPYRGAPEDRALVKVCVEAGRATEFRRDPPDRPYARHVGLYAFGPGVLARCAATPVSARAAELALEQVAWMEAGIAVEVVDVAEAPMAVDTPGQLLAARSHTWR